MSTLVTNRDKNEGAVFVVLAFLLEICNISLECFNHILSVPSPFPVFANFYDWIFAFVDEFINGDRYSYAYANQFAQGYMNKLKENLIQFEINIRQ